MKPLHLISGILSWGENVHPAWLPTQQRSKHSRGWSSRFIGGQHLKRWKERARRRALRKATR